MPVSGLSGMGGGARVNPSYQGEGPSSTKGSKQKARKPKLMTGKLTYKKMVADSNKLLPKKKFMPKVVSDTGKNGKTKRR